MLRPRIIPCLLVQNKGLVKTVKFKDPKYVGDPLNAVKIFNEKEVDELMVVDIDATRESRPPDFGLIKNLAAECRMPLCYGGGVTTVEQARKIISLGAEKVAISYAAMSNPEIIPAMAEAVGRQSVVVVLDVRKKMFGGYEIYTHNNKKSTGKNPVKYAQYLNDLGIGELVINSIDKDGTMQGYDFNLVDKIRAVTDMPLTVLGGAGSMDDIRALIDRYGVIGAAAGSFFVFKGKYRAVLISYPSLEEKKPLTYNLS